MKNSVLPSRRDILNSKANELGLKKPHVMAGFGLLCGLIGVLYYSVYQWMVDIWIDDKSYSHGFIVPFIALYLVWIKRKHLVAVTIKPSYLWGGLILFASGLLLIVGRAGAIIQVESISFLCVLPGIVLFVLGWRYLKALALPLFYLQFMVPWNDELIERIHLPFQHFSADVGSSLLRAVGYPVFQDEIFIYLPDISMEVAKACSGVNFLTSVIAVGIPLVYLTQKTWLRAGFVLLAGVLVTLLTNGLRVMLAGVMGQEYGLAMLHGPRHIFQGWFVAWIGVAGLFFINWLVARYPSSLDFRLFERWKSLSPKRPPTSRHRDCFRPLSISCLFLLGIGLYMHLVAVPHPLPLKKSLSEFPHQIGVWQERPSSWSDSKGIFLDPDQEISLSYRGDGGKEINLYMGYYASQKPNKRLISQRVKSLHRDAVEVSSGLIDFGPRDVTHSIHDFQERSYELVHWYLLPSGECTGRYRTKIQTVIDAVIHRRNNAAVIMIATPASSEKRAGQISPAIKNFLQVLSPVLDEFGFTQG